MPWEGFRVTLQCVHRWREYVRRPGDRQERTHYHRDVLWEADQVSAGEPDQHRGAVSVPVRFALPADQPASTLFRSEEDPSVIVGFERWSSAAAHDQHLKGAHVQRLMDAMDGVLAEPLNIVSYNVIDEE